MLLAGGQGSRLKVLTENTAKPAVYFSYRFPSSNRDYELPPTFLKKWRWYPYSSPALWTGSPVQAGSRGSYPFDGNTFV